MSSFVRVVQDLALIAIRLVLALVLAAHAWHRYHTVGMAAETALLRSHAVPQPEFFAWAATIGEAAGALGLAFGLFTPLVGLGMLVGNVLVIVWMKWHSGLYVTGGGYEYNLVLAAFGLLFLCFGAGRGGLDQLFRRRRPAGD